MLNLKDIRISYPKAFVEYARYLHKILTKEQYKSIMTWHSYIHYMYVLSFLKKEGFDSISILDGYVKLEIKENPVKLIEHSIERGLLYVEEKYTEEIPF